MGMKDPETESMTSGMSWKTLANDEVAIKLSVPKLSAIRPMAIEQVMRIRIILDKHGNPSRMAIEASEK
jgi:hypothetical protein